MIRLSIALIILFNPAWTLADDRLWGTWDATDPQTGDELTFTFSEDGTFHQDVPNLQQETSDAMLTAGLIEMGVNVELLPEFGIELPVVQQIVLVGRWVVEDNWLELKLSSGRFYIDDQQYVSLNDLLIGILLEIKNVGLTVSQEELLAQMIEYLQSEGVEGEILAVLQLKARYYFADDQLVIISNNPNNDDVVFTRQASTAVQDASWGKIKASRKRGER